MALDVYKNSYPILILCIIIRYYSNFLGRKNPVCAYTISNCTPSNSIRVPPLFYDIVNPTYAHFSPIPNLHLATRISRNLRTRSSLIRGPIFEADPRANTSLFTTSRYFRSPNQVRSSVRKRIPVSCPMFVFFEGSIRGTCELWRAPVSIFGYKHGQCFNWIWHVVPIGDRSVRVLRRDSNQIRIGSRKALLRERKPITDVVDVRWRV